MCRRYLLGVLCVTSGISLDMVRVLLQLAKTPQHVQVALQCVTVWQHNQPNWQQKQNMDRKVPIDIGKLICKAAIRVGAPEIGISWLQVDFSF